MEDFIVIKEAVNETSSGACDFCDSMCSDCGVVGDGGTCYSD